MLAKDSEHAASGNTVDAAIQFLDDINRSLKATNFLEPNAKNTLYTPLLSGQITNIPTINVDSYSDALNFENDFFSMSHFLMSPIPPLPPPPPDFIRVRVSPLIPSTPTAANLTSMILAGGDTHFNRILEATPLTMGQTLSVPVIGNFLSSSAMLSPASDLSTVTSFDMDTFLSNGRNEEQQQQQMLGFIGSTDPCPQISQIMTYGRKDTPTNFKFARNFTSHQDLYIQKYPTHAQLLNQQHQQILQQQQLFEQKQLLEKQTKEQQFLLLRQNLQQQHLNDQTSKRTPPQCSATETDFLLSPIPAVTVDLLQTIRRERSTSNSEPRDFQRNNHLDQSDALFLDWGCQNFAKNAIMDQQNKVAASDFTAAENKIIIGENGCF
ncbi:hypothetical protein HK100_007149 [Physocladia obscura]|uniref:Uncharacterized protein n=1 Tax=Physocladia obscura TaxID=109957 RepID=A0AAD5XC93_9FUNG|nr:hypothetical protein HK100_007149 [Physocladia obscura]